MLPHKSPGGLPCWLLRKDLSDRSRIKSDSQNTGGHTEARWGLAKSPQEIRDLGLTSGRKSGAQGVR